MASETCAFDLVGAEYVREIEPGELVRISRSGVESLRFAPPKPHQFCVFEHVYFARPDSLVFGRPVDRSREMLGRLLAREQPADADLVVPVPDSGVPAAIGYALESGLPFRMGLIRNHYIGRTFIEPEQAIRDFGVKLKLNPVRALLEGKRVVLVDDSIVRGTTSRKIVRMVREAGATEVHMRISCPPTISPCYYGIDTPTREELLAADASVIRPRLPEGGRPDLSGPARTLEEIRLFLDADSVGYLSLESLRRAVGDTDGSFCTSCYTGSTPRKRAARSSCSGRRSSPEPDGPDGKLERKERTMSDGPSGIGPMSNPAADSALPASGTAASASAPSKTRSPTLRDHVVRELLSWVWVALAFFLITGTMVQARVIPSASMESTLLVGDHLLMSRFGYDVGLPFTRYHVRLWREPHRQQVVIFHAPIPGHEEDFIKRLIGMPGDTVEIRQGRRLRQRQALSEPYRHDPPNPARQLRPGDRSRAQLFRAGR